MVNNETKPERKLKKIILISKSVKNFNKIKLFDVVLYERINVTTVSAFGQGPIS